MDSMYDRLGELLKDSLEQGTLASAAKKTPPPRAEKAEAKTEQNTTGRSDANAKDAENVFADAKADTVKIINFTKEKKAEFLRVLTKKSKRGEVLRAESTAAKKARRLVPVPKNVAQAYRLLGVKTGAEMDEIREAYRARLKMFHPDAHGENEIVQKVAHQKTEETVEAYKLISAWKGRSMN